jgi:hypothetical protein
MTPEGRIHVPDALPGDPRLRPVLAQLLRPSPAERFASARDVQQALLSPLAVQPLVGQPLVGQPLVGQPAGARAVARGAADPLLLGPVPRAIEGPTAALFKRVAPRTLDLMDDGSKQSDDVGVFDYLALAFFSVLTAGILPVTFLSMARGKRRRLRRFFREGLPATAEILAIQLEKLPFDAKIARVSYQFEADGMLHRDVDQVRLRIADRWRAGDAVQVLYLPEHDYDSVIISTR